MSARRANIDNDVDFGINTYPKPSSGQPQLPHTITIIDTAVLKCIANIHTDNKSRYPYILHG